MVDPYRLFFYIPTSPYGREKEPCAKIVVHVATRWHANYHKQLRYYIEVETGLISTQNPNWQCGWKRELDVQSAAVHRATIDISLDGESTATMNAELKGRLENVLRTTYPWVEIALVFLCTVGLYLVVFIKCKNKEQREGNGNAS